MRLLAAARCCLLRRHVLLEAALSRHLRRHSSKACGSRALGAIHGLMVLIGLLIILPMLGAQLGVNLNYISGAFAIATRTIINGILYRLKLCESATCKLQMMGSAAQHSKAIAQNPAGPKCANSQPESMVKSAVAPPIPTVP